MASPSRLPAVRRPAGAGSKPRPMSLFDVPADHLKKLKHLGEGGESNGLEGQLAAESVTSKQNKRRSLLPQFSSRKVSGDEKEGQGTIQEDTSESEASIATDMKDDRKTMPPPPKPRPTSMRPPGTVVPNRTTSINARNASKGTAKSGDLASTFVSSTASSRHESGLTRTGSSRLPHSPLVGAPGATSQQAVPPRGSSTRATRSTTAQKRSSVVLERPPALDTSVQSSQTQPSPTSPTNSITTRQSVRTQLQPPSRPTFSTYQQHYSPAKSSLPKPGLPTAKASKLGPAVVIESDPAMTFEVAMEQIELLQLSLLHQTSGQKLQEYEASAKQTLGRRHAKLRENYEAVRASEQEHRRLNNLAALESWCGDPALLAEHLQTLDRVTADLRMHTEPGSRYSEVSETFEKWATRAESILFDDQESASFIEALPESWRSVHTSLALKLRSTQRDIGVLPPAPPRSNSETSSSVEVILENCSALVDSMLKELEVMTKLQKEVLQRGKVRIDEQINALIYAGDSTRDLGKENWIPAWQSVT